MKIAVLFARFALIGSTCFAIASAYAGDIVVNTGNSSWWGSAGYVQVADFNRDFKTDIASPDVRKVINPGVQTRRGWASSGFPLEFFATQTNPQGQEPWGAGPYTFAGDFDGDGDNDIVSFSGGTAYLKRNNRPFGGADQVWDFVHFALPVANLWGQGGYTFSGDFNGDGVDDVASASGSSVYMKLGSSTGFQSVTWTGASNQWGQGGYTFSGDFNGDGYSDIASMSGSTAYMKLSTGSGFTSAAWPINGTWGQGGYTFAGDFNGDGLTDIATAIGSVVHIKTSTGSGFSYAGTHSVNPSWGTPDFTHAADFTGDGVDDIMTAIGGTIIVKILND